MNPEHVAITRQGSGSIAAWRRAHPDERLDLSGANLIGADLTGANLVGAELIGANLAGANLTVAHLVMANLTGADLAGASLIAADLSEADLRRADLSRANLSGASLIAADLSEADLTAANLSGAHLGGADLSGSHLRLTVFYNTVLAQVRFSGAYFTFTVMADCDLSAALGLETVVHEGPSSIGLDTIVRSAGNIPETFLRGAGVPDTSIAYVRSLVTEPLQFYTCFISYASPDQAFAQRLYNDLQGKGVRCWYYPETSILGRRVWEDIDRAIRVYDKLVVICSRSSLNSPAVLREIEHALAKEDAIARENAQKLKDSAKGEQPRLKDKDVLFPIRLDNYVFDGWEHQRKLDVTNRTVGDFVGWRRSARKYEAALHRLLHALNPKSWPAVE